MASLRVRDGPGAWVALGGLMGPAWRRSGRLFGRSSAREDVDREIRSHLEFRADELERAGWTTDEARREAERLFGDRQAISEGCRRVTERHYRSVRRGMMWGAILQDVRYAIRALARSPGFTIVGVVTLAVGIGANASIFSVVNGVLLKPLPYDEPDALVQVRETNNRGGAMRVAWANFVDWTDESGSFTGLTGYGMSRTTVLGAEQPLSLPVAQVSADFWNVFRVAPVNGRLTTPEDHGEGAAPVLVIGERVWQEELGGAPIETLMLEAGGVRAPVVGVVPATFDFPDGAEVWGAAEPFGNTSRTSHNWTVVGRLDPGTTVEVAEQEMDALTKVVVLREADADPDFIAVGASVVLLRDRIVGSSRTPLILLFGAAGLVLLIACTNLASTLLARGTTRLRELAIRSSLGAGRGRIVRQLVTESLVLSLVGGGAGIAVAVVTTRVLRTLGPASLPRIDDITVDATVVGFATLAAIGSTLIFGLAPALRLTRVGTSTAIKAGARGTSGDHQGSIWRILVGTEVALALVLLSSSGLLVRSFQQLLDEELGFDATDVATMPVALSRIKYETADDHARLYTQLIEELQAHPSVRSARTCPT